MKIEQPLITFSPELSGELLKEYEAKAQVLKAMAHPTRLFILDLLKEKDLCVCEINSVISADVSTVSKHLNVLKSAGIVSFKKQGLQVYYKLEKPCLVEALNCAVHKDLMG